jgi:hypothetical protein
MWFAPDETASRFSAFDARARGKSRRHAIEPNQQIDERR